MKFRNSLYAVAVFALLSSVVCADEEVYTGLSADAELVNTRALLNFAREDIIKEELRLSEAVAAQFWPVYDRYQAELQLVRDRHADNLINYTKAYRSGTVSEAHASQLVEDYLGVKSELLTIKKRYVNDFREILSPRVAARFYQIENKIELELEYQLSQIIPLIDPV